MQRAMQKDTMEDTWVLSQDKRQSSFAKATEDKERQKTKDKRQRVKIKEYQKIAFAF
jgi:hypothetical protein